MNFKLFHSRIGIIKIEKKLLLDSKRMATSNFNQLKKSEWLYESKYLFEFDANNIFFWTTKNVTMGISALESRSLR